MADYLKKAPPRDVRDVFNHCKNLHGVYRHHKQGWTNDKDKSMRHVTSIPLWVLFDPEWGKYFSREHNSIDLKKDVDAFIRKADWFDFRKSK